MNKKICSKCNKEFPATPEYFYRKKSGKYRLMSECKECNNLRRKCKLELLPVAIEGYKICRKCNRELPATLKYFYKKESSGDGLRSNCKDCEKQHALNYFKTEIGKEIHQKSNKVWYYTHQDEIIEKSKEYYKSNKELIKLKHKNYRRTDNGKQAKRKDYAKRKRMQSIELYSNPFDDTIEIDWHHINDMFVVALPRKIHRKYLGVSTKKHRELCYKYVKLFYGDILCYIINL